MNHRYHTNVFWSAEDVCWIADVPDLHYCSAHGETPVEAMAEAQEAIVLWLETAREEGLPHSGAALPAGGSCFPRGLGRLGCIWTSA